MHNHPERGVRLLTSAGEAGHLPALATLALAYEKGRYGLEKDLYQAHDLYQKTVKLYESGDYLGEVDERFIAFQRSRLQLTERLIQSLESNPQ